MSRKLKNIIMVLLVVLLAGSLTLTMYYAKDIGSANQENKQMQAPPGTSEDSSSNSENKSKDNSSKDASGSTSSDSSSSNSNMQTPPGDSNAQNGNAPGGGQGMGMPGDRGQNISMLCYLLLAIQSLALAFLFLYLVMSKFNTYKFRETFKNKDKVLIYFLSVIIITGVLTFASGYIARNFLTGAGNGTASAQDVSASGATEVIATQTLDGNYESSAEDESALLVKDGGELTLTGSTIKKTGDSTNTENSEFYGINSGILVTKASSATIKDASVTTDAAGSNAVFSTGTDSKISISDSTIKTTGKSSARGLDATYGGNIEASNVDITTQGGSCASLATDRGEGTVTAKDSKLETNGAGSPVIYSTGKISIHNTTGTANGSQAVVIEGKNSAAVENSKLTCSGAGNRNNVDNAGVMIYQSMSGDAGEGTGTLTCRSSSITIPKTSDYYKTAPMFFVTNTDAEINLEDASLSYGSGVLLSAKGTDEWGNSGSNGGNITFNAVTQKLDGTIELDKLSTLNMKLEKSNYKGTINGDNSAKSIKLVIDKDSKITLTGDSYVTSLEDADTSYSNIDRNGHTLYINGKAL